MLYLINVASVPRCCSVAAYCCLQEDKSDGDKIVYATFCTVYVTNIKNIMYYFYAQVQIISIYKYSCIYVYIIIV